MSGAAAGQPDRSQPELSRWHNHVPAWIWNDERIMHPPRGERLATATIVHLLQCAANAGDRDEHGSILNIIGGRRLAERAKVSRRTLAIYEKHLVEHGALVLLSRGGVLRDAPDPRSTKPKPGGRNLANIYGLPAWPGALDHRRVKRREQTMRPTGEQFTRELKDGSRVTVPTFAPQIIRPGEQIEIWPRRHQPSPAEAGYHEPGAARIGPPPIPPDASPEVRDSLPQGEPAPDSKVEPSAAMPEAPPQECQRSRLQILRDQLTDSTGAHRPRDALEAPVHYPQCTQYITRNVRSTHPHTPKTIPPRHGSNHGAIAAQRHGGVRDARERQPPRGSPHAGEKIPIRHIEDRSILDDTPRLLVLHREETARRATKASALEWVAAAVRAVETERAEGGDARSIFAGIVNRELWDYATDAHRAEARRRLKKSQVSIAANQALGLIFELRRTRGNHNPMYVYRKKVDRSITKDRWDQMLEELRRHGHDV